MTANETHYWTNEELFRAHRNQVMQRKITELLIQLEDAEKHQDLALQQLIHQQILECKRNILPVCDPEREAIIARLQQEQAERAKAERDEMSDLIGAIIADLRQIDSTRGDAT